MGKLDVTHLPYMSKEDFRVLVAIEMGMKNHELVGGPLVAQLANLRSGGVMRKLRSELCQNRLAAYERGKKYDGYRLTNKGYDYLALKSLISRGTLQGMGSEIGKGKESDIFCVMGQEGRELCMKLHRLGRTSFRKLKEKRDFHKGREMSWLYLSRLSAAKEFAYMRALYDRGFPVPEPIDVNRHCLLMELIIGHQLHKVHKLDDPGQLYSDLMDLIVQFANNGVIHSDFNEFNIMINNQDKPIIIDFPQMVSTNHENAQMYFDRDVQCIVTIFKRKFDYESEYYPDFHRDVKKVFSLDKEVAASGYNREVREFDEMLAKYNRAEELRGRGGSSEPEQSEDDSDLSDVEEAEEESEDDGDVEDKECEESADDGDLSEVPEKDDDDGIKTHVSDDSQDAYKTSSELVEAVKAVESTDGIVRDSTFNATMEMYFRSLKTDKVSTDKVSTEILDCRCQNEICGPECFHNIELLASTTQEAASDNRELTDKFHTVSIAESYDTKPTTPSSVDDSDRRSTASRRSRARSSTGHKLDDTQRQALKEKLLLARKMRREAREKGEEPPMLCEFLEESKNDDDRLTGFTFSTLASTVDPAVMKVRMQREYEKKEAKQVSKKNLRVKGEANAFNRKKKENQLNIRESLACDIFD